MRKYSATGIAIDNHCAMKFVDGQFRVITAKRGVDAYQFFRKNNKVVIDEIHKKNAYLPIAQLYE